MPPTGDRIDAVKKPVESSLGTIPRHSLKAEVVCRMRDAIERGELKPGDQITEMGLARKFGVGQPAIREALLELQFLGFVERIGPRKTCITALSERQIQEIYLVRTRLEMLAVELLASAAGPDLTECRRELANMRRAAEAGQAAVFHSADFRFHRALWGATGNRSLGDALEPLVARLFAFGVIQHANPTPGKMLEIAAYHGQLLDLIEAGEVEGARRLAEDSLQQARADDLET
jgi:DNA-binding GntR family transcriptional regulator